MIDLVTKLKQAKKQEYIESLAMIDKMTPVYRRTHVLAMKVQSFFVDCEVVTTYTPYRPIVALYLTKGYNIRDDVNLFLDKEEEFIAFLLHGAELTPKWYKGVSLDFHLGGVYFEVYYSGGRCIRKQVGTKTVEEPIYEVECE